MEQYFSVGVVILLMILPWLVVILQDKRQKRLYDEDKSDYHGGW